MPMDIERKVTTTDESPVGDHVSQTSTVTHVPTSGEAKEAKADRGNAWIWYVIGLINLLLVLRIVFLIFGAQSVGFAEILYGITGFLSGPFQGIFPAPVVGGAYFDTASLAGIIVYSIIGWVISRLVDLATRPANSKKI